MVLEINLKVRNCSSSFADAMSSGGNRGSWLASYGTNSEVWNSSCESSSSVRSHPPTFPFSLKRLDLNLKLKSMPYIKPHGSKSIRNQRFTNVYLAATSFSSTTFHRTSFPILCPLFCKGSKTLQNWSVSSAST